MMYDHRPSIWDKPESVDTLRAMWAANAAVADIAVVIGTTRMSVIGKRYRLGLPPRDPNATAKAKRKEAERAAPVNKWLPKVGRPWQHRRLTMEQLLAPDSNPATLTDRTGCCFPVNDGGPFLFCNAPTSADYCEFHKTMMFEPRKKK